MKALASESGREIEEKAGQRNKSCGKKKLRGLDESRDSCHDDMSLPDGSRYWGGGERSVSSTGVRNGRYGRFTLFEQVIRWSDTSVERF